jgi:hypothetical protein
MDTDKAKSITPAAGPEPYEVSTIGPGITHVVSRVPLMTKDVAVPMCNAMTRSVKVAPIKAVVMDLATISKATPAAAIYALGRMKHADIERMALVGGNAFMRLLARIILSLAGFPEFQFFDSESSAIVWASVAKED